MRGYVNGIWRLGVSQQTAVTMERADCIMLPLLYLNYIVSRLYDMKMIPLNRLPLRSGLQGVSFADPDKFSEVTIA